MWLEYFEQYLDRVFPRFLSEKPWNYKDDLCMVGAEDLYCATGSESWREPVRRNASFLMDDAGRVANWVPGEHNIDKVSFGKSMRILRDVTGEARWAEGVERAYRILADYPRTVTGNFWHKDIYPDQVWLDGLYMGMPFYAACLTENGEDNWDDILDQFTSAHKLLWDEQLGLYRHANDCSRKMEWADPVTGQSPVVWLRAEGWFLMALADTYEIAKDRTPRAGELCPLLKNAPEYGEKGSRVLDGIRDTYLKKGEQGWELHGICASAGLGPGPDNRTDRTGTPEYYLSEKQMVDNQHGAAACMMAVSEQLRRA